MTAIASGSTTAEAGRWATLDRVRVFVGPVAVAILALLILVTGWSAVNRVDSLLSWDATYSGAGEFTVVACEPEAVFGPDRWLCDGRLTRGGSPDVIEATLAVGKDAWMSSRPYVGQRLDVFYDPASETGGVPEIVYSRDAQLGELARLFFALVPLVMIAIGAAGWLLGMLVGRLMVRSPADSWWRRSPLFSDLRRRGSIWLMVGVGVLVVHQLIVSYILGSAGVA